MIVQDHAQEPDIRTNVVIDDCSMEQALKLSGLHTRKDVIEAGLKLLVRLSAMERVKEYRGRLLWEGDFRTTTRPRPRQGSQ